MISSSGNHAACRHTVKNLQESKRASDLATIILSKVDKDPDVKVEALMERIASKIQVDMPYHKVARARQNALSNTYGDFGTSYEYLESYLEKSIDVIKDILVT